MTWHDFVESRLWSGLQRCRALSLVHYSTQQCARVRTWERVIEGDLFMEGPSLDPAQPAYVAFKLDLQGGNHIEAYIVVVDMTAWKWVQVAQIEFKPAVYSVVGVSDGLFLAVEDKHMMDEAVSKLLRG